MPAGRTQSAYVRTHSLSQDSVPLVLVSPAVSSFAEPWLGNAVVQQSQLRLRLGRVGLFSFYTSEADKRCGNQLLCPALIRL